MVEGVLGVGVVLLVVSSLVFWRTKHLVAGVAMGVAVGLLTSCAVGILSLFFGPPFQFSVTIAGFYFSNEAIAFLVPMVAIICFLLWRRDSKKTHTR